MNVLFDHQIFQTQRFGGISRYFYELISRVAKQPGIDVSVFAGLYINRYGIEKHKESFKYFFGARRPDIKKTGRLFGAANNLLYRALAPSIRPDIVHETYYTSSNAGSRVPRILTVYDMIHERYPENFTGDPSAELKRRAVKRAERIIAISHSTKRDLVEILGVPENRVDVTYLGNSLDYPPGPAVITSPYLLFVGGRSGYKNFELALEAYAGAERLKDDFILISFGSGPFTAEERESIRKKGLEGRVLYETGSDEKLATLYRHAQALMYPSLYEGFGLPILEAMHYQCPVICGKSSSIPEVAGDAAIYFDPTSAESLVAAIKSLVYDGSARKKYAELGLKQESRFSWDRCARETAATYRSI